jgi:hypothetical protein
MTNHKNILELGRAGELVVIEMLESLGIGLHIRDMYLENKYDREKDILVDGKYRVEVKTQAPFVKMNAFTFLPNQITKCTSADVLYFVSVPHPTWPHFSDGWIYRAVPSEMKYHPWKDRWGKDRIIIPIEQEALIQVTKMTDEKAKELQSLLSTMY